MDQILSDLREVTLTVLVPILVAVIGYYGRLALAAVVAELEAKAGASRTNLIGTLITNFIFAAEQTAGLETGEKKKAFVIDRIMEAAAKHKIDVTETEITAMIEGAISQLKRQNVL